METGTSADGSTFTRSTETIQNLNLLGGAIQATSSEGAQRGALQARVGLQLLNASTVVGLTINGNPINLPAPNTRIDLPGIGFVIVERAEAKREVELRLAGGEPAPRQGHGYQQSGSRLAVGTEITVAHAFAGLSTPIPIGGLVKGSASGIHYRLKGGNRPEPARFDPVPGGSSTANLASVNVPNISRLRRSRPGGRHAGPTKTVGHTTATIQNANLLNGLVTATAVKAVAHGEYNGTNYSFNSNGSSFVGLNVLGPVNPAPNTTIQLANVGTLYLYQRDSGPEGDHRPDDRVCSRRTTTSAFPVGRPSGLGTQTSASPILAWWGAVGGRPPPPGTRRARD